MIKSENITLCEIGFFYFILWLWLSLTLSVGYIMTPRRPENTAEGRPGFRRRGRGVCVAELIAAELSHSPRLGAKVENEPLMW